MMTMMVIVVVITITTLIDNDNDDSSDVKVVYANLGSFLIIYTPVSILSVLFLL